MRIASLLGLAVLLAACHSNPPPAAPATTPATATTAPAADMKKPGEAKIGDKTTCPVSGEEFVVTKDSPHADVNGKTYYFCCPGCDQKFKADPAKYTHGA